MAGAIANSCYYLADSQAERDDVRTRRLRGLDLTEANMITHSRPAGGGTADKRYGYATSLRGKASRRHNSEIR